MKYQKFTAKTLAGLESVLSDEITAFGGKDVETARRAVNFRADQHTLYKINIASRLALRIIKPIKYFRAKNSDQLYYNAKKILWTKIISVNDTFLVDSVVNSNYFRHSKYAALRLKDAIADQFKEKMGKRPNVDTSRPDIRINLHIENDNCTVSLDSTGESLHKRGYREKGENAPLNEVLAAGMIILSGWDGKTDFIDPMCGSGTIGIEAALIARNIPPNLGRSFFSFMKWKDFDKGIYESVKKELSSVRKDFNGKIICSDKNNKAVSSAKSNARKAKIGDLISFHSNDFFTSDFKINSGTLITNPPYGERLKEENLFEFYKNIGDTLKQKYKGIDAWVLSSNKESMKKIGLRTSRRLTLFNGALECKYYNYQLYEGSRKKKYE